MSSTSTTDRAHTHADPSSIHLTYTIQPPPEAPQPANTPSHKSLSVPIDLPLSSTPGAPFSSRQSETAYLSALADSVDEMKRRVMVDMSAWKDAVGKYEDMEARRAGSRAVPGKKSDGGKQPQHEEGEDSEDEEEDDEDDKEDE